MRRRGFSLIEVLFAIALFAVAATALASAYINVLNSYFLMSRSVRNDDDVKFARATLIAETDLDTAKQGGEFEGPGGRKVRWSAAVEPTNIADLFQVTFTCEINDPAEKQPLKIEQTFRLLRPTWSQAADREKLRATAKERISALNASSLTR